MAEQVFVDSRDFEETKDEEFALDQFNQDSKTMYVVKGGWIKLWDGRYPVRPHAYDNLKRAIMSTFMDDAYFNYKIYVNDEGQLCCDGTHHDSGCDCNHFIICELTDKGYEMYTEMYHEGNELPPEILEEENTIKNVVI